MAESITWLQLQRDAARRVAAMEARWIVEAVSGLRGAALLANQDDPAPVGAVKRVDDMLTRRVAGEPLQYVIGEWEFRGVDVFVDPRVLI
ncbi:MAG: peptide chain release factor N(5)-glutamine methyltransferase, partial [Acidimicrobiia bacterium]|nr:peptide chain release factor N(5)-glutamine methyltransferase [Acidimicrobiia bacterium]